MFQVAIFMSRLSYGHVAGPGVYSTTITRPRLFRDLPDRADRLLIRNHGVPVEVGPSTSRSRCTSPSPRGPCRGHGRRPHRRGRCATCSTCPTSRSPTTPSSTAPSSRARRAAAAGAVHGAAHRLFAAPPAHYTATSPEHFQNFVLFTNYQFYVDEFAPRRATA
jgi:AMP nucleosidase